MSCLKMFCKNCHSSDEQGEVYTSQNLMDGKRFTCTVPRNFVCNTCGATGGNFLSPGEEDGVFFQSQAARRLLCHPLPSVFRRQEAEGRMPEEKGSRLTLGNPGPKFSAPLAVRTFDIDDFAFGAVSTTFTHHPPSSSLSSSPESANSGSLHESNTGQWRRMEGEAKHPVLFSSNNQRQSRGKPGLRNIYDSNVSCADVSFRFEPVKKGEIVSFRQTRNWLKKQTSLGSVFTSSCDGKLQGVPAPTHAHMKKSPSSSVEANSNLGRSKPVDCRSQLSGQEDLDEDMTRILDQLNASFKLEA